LFLDRLVTNYIHPNWFIERFDVIDDAKFIRKIMFEQLKIAYPYFIA